MLGKGTLRKRQDKSKAHPAEFPGLGDVDINHAFDELTAAAFALWLRIAGEREACHEGRPALARLTGYSPRRIAELLQELEHKGYVGFVRRPNPYADAIVIHRRCVVGARSGFVRLSA